MPFYKLLSLRSALVVIFALAGSTSLSAATIIRFETSLGDFDVQLSDATMPRTVQNFLHYVNADKFNGSVVHRNSDTEGRDFVIQGGGYYLQDPAAGGTTITYSSVATIAPIADEPGGGVTGPSNVRGTIAMAKSGKNTATSQWFINQGDNSFLDNPTRPDGGFSAFGMVLGNGMSVVDAIGNLKIPSELGFSIASPFNDLPLRNFSGNTLQQIRVANTITIDDVRVLNLSAGDFDRNGVVNAADLTLLKANYGITSGAYFDDGDANMDGRVDGVDFLAWQRSFGSVTAPIAAVPEPAAATLALLAAAACGLARRRSQ
jgi:peptidyl-prolyl cis-trans isomerase A (cyclophilin A)